MIILAIIAIVLFVIDLVLNIMVLRMDRKEPKSAPIIAYKCDESAQCSRYCKDKDDRYCHHTLDIKHAANFEEIEPGMFMEKVEREKED